MDMKVARVRTTKAMCWKRMKWNPVTPIFRCFRRRCGYKNSRWLAFSLPIRFLIIMKHLWRNFMNNLIIILPLLLSEAKSAVDYFEIFFKKGIRNLCQWTTEKLTRFKVITFKPVKVFGLKWHPEQMDKMYIFVSYLLLMGIEKLSGTIDWSSSIFYSRLKGLNLKKYESQYEFKS